MKTKLIKGARKRFDEAKRDATREGQRLCRGSEKAYCRGETWITATANTSDGESISHYDIFQEPFFQAAYPKRSEIDSAIRATVEELDTNPSYRSEALAKKMQRVNDITFYVETQVYSYNTADDFGREFPTPHGQHVCEEIAEVTI